MNHSDHTNRQDTEAKYVSRRTALRAGSIAAAMVLAGCSQSDAQATPDTTQSSAQQSDLIDDIRFDAQDLVVELTADHNVSTVNLIAPDGTLFSSESVQTGVSTVRLELLSPDLMTGDFDHYSIGNHEIVLETPAGSQSVTIDLTPSLEITDVYQYRGGDSDRSLGQVGIEITNNGSGPTWVYDISFENSPYYGANDGLHGDPGVVLLESPKKPEGLIIGPKESQKYVPTDTPLFFNSDEQTCNETYNMTVVAGVATGESLTKQVLAAGGGGSTNIPSSDRMVCENIDIRIGGAGS